ncbi:MAG TPA: M48 family metallopeptidase [Candidatus Acidoferrum sp.]|nr:M48 family metallopeptidase [Candidatus Acidoferrum sp.]
MFLRRIRATNWSLFLRRAIALGLAAGLALNAPSAFADRTQIKPGVNMFSTDDDVRMGQKLAADAEAKLPMLNDLKVDGYLNRLGAKLAAYAPGPAFAYEFHCVNAEQLNSFALPGGFVFVNRAIIEQSSNEAQLAGVMAHEISHVALRHGTNQATKKEMGTGIVGIAGAIIGGGILTNLASQISGSLAESVVLLKYSRTSEDQADILGTQILFDAGYDPRAMAQFFEKIEAESKGRQRPEFFSNHPIPAHRIDRVTDEIDNMGGLPENYKTDSADFREIRRYILSLPAAPEKGDRGIFAEPRDPAAVGSISADSSVPSTKVAKLPSSPASADFPDSTEYVGDTFALRHPESWKLTGSGDMTKIVPLGRLVKDANGNPATTVGIITDNFPVNPEDEGATIGLATDAYLAGIRERNPSLTILGEGEAIQVDGLAAIAMKLSADSPLGGNETRLLITVLKGDRLISFVVFAPANDYAGYEDTFKQIISSIHFAH